MEKPLRYNLITGCNFLYSDISYWNDLIKEKIRILQQKLNNMEELYNIHFKVCFKIYIFNIIFKLYFFQNPLIENLLSGNFIPSKTGKNGLNFVRGDDENNLINKEQPDEIKEFFKVIYILLKEPFENLPDCDIIINIKTTIFPKYNVDSFSKYFL